jgi:hypothetical protein
MAEASESSTSLGSVWAVVPSIYYDLIARVAPGALFLLSIDDARTLITLPSDGLRWVLVLGSSYVAGLVLTPLSDLVIAPVWGLCNVPLVRQWLDIPGGARVPRCANDVIEAVRPELGSTLAKMQAETVLCGNLAAGYALLLWLPVKSLLTSYKVPECNRSTLIGGFVFLVVVASYRYVLYIGRQVQVYKILIDENLKKSGDSRDAIVDVLDPSG